jgi:hypothetical protein
MNESAGLTHCMRTSQAARTRPDWWSGCLARAGVIAEGTTRGERMHKARHTAGQRVLQPREREEGTDSAA